MRNCNQCQKRIRTDLKTDICKQCLSLCPCGAYKDWRAERCQSCASKIKVKAQWQNPEIRARMTEALQVAGEKRRIKYEDLTWNSFYLESDGRFAAVYNPPGSNKRKSVRRYVWVWVKANGPVPKGHVIHHKDHDRTHDVLDNLELKTKSEHSTHHGLAKPKAEWICQECGKQFANGRRAGVEPRKFCSKDCHYKNKTTFGGKCETFQAANVFTENLIN
jgi:hypothetical protein